MSSSSFVGMLVATSSDTSELPAQYTAFGGDGFSECRVGKSKRARKTSEKQIPRGLKSAREDKIRELYGAAKAAPLQNLGKPEFSVTCRARVIFGRDFARPKPGASTERQSKLLAG